MGFVAHEGGWYSTAVPTVAASNFCLRDRGVA